MVLLMGTIWDNLDSKIRLINRARLKNPWSQMVPIKGQYSNFYQYLSMSFLLALTLLLTPAYVIKFTLFGLPTDVLMTSVILFWIIFGVWLIVKKTFGKFWASVKSLNKKVLVLIGLFFIAGIISMFIGGLDRPKLGQFIVLFLQPISIFFIGRYLTSKFPNTKNLLLVTCYLLLILTGAYAIFQYFTLTGLPPAWWGNSDEPKRALSFFIHPNFYALWCTPLLAFLIPDVAATVKGQMSGIKCFKAISWIIGALGLFLSLSRAGWFGLAAAILIYLIFAADKKIRKIILSAVIVMVIVIVAIPNFRYRLILPLYGEKSSISRLSLWETGWKGVKESPILGLGLTGFSHQWNILNTDKGLTDTHNFPHNIFLDLWVETGIIGLISLIGLIGLYIYRGLRGASPPQLVRRSFSEGGVMGRAPGEVDFMPLAISLFLIALIVQGQIDNPYFKNDLAMVFWIILALV
jgi:O-antigen ligase